MQLRALVVLEVELVEGVVGGRARVAVVVGVAVVEVRRLLLDPLPLDSLVLQLGFVLFEVAGRHLGLAPEADGVGGGRRPQLPRARLSCAVVRRRGSFVVVVTEMEAVTIQSLLFLCNLRGGESSDVVKVCLIELGTKVHMKVRNHGEGIYPLPYQGLGTGGLFSIVSK